MTTEKTSKNQPSKGYKFTRDDLILVLVIIWAVCMIVFRY